MTTAGSLFFIALILLPLGMMFMAYNFKRSVLAWASIIPWLVFGLNAYGYSTAPSGGPWDIYYALFWSSIGLILLCIVEALLIRPRKQDSGEDVHIDDVDRYASELERYQKMTILPRIPRRRR